MPVTAREAADELRRRYARAREADEERARAARELATRTARALLAPGARAWLIGSVVWGGFGARSDVDVVVEALSSADATRLEIELTRRLGLAVDLLRLEELPEPFRERVRREGTLIHG